MARRACTARANEPVDVGEPLPQSCTTHKTGLGQLERGPSRAGRERGGVCARATRSAQCATHARGMANSGEEPASSPTPVLPQRTHASLARRARSSSTTNRDEQARDGEEEGRYKRLRGLPVMNQSSLPLVRGRACRSDFGAVDGGRNSRRKKDIAPGTLGSDVNDDDVL